MQWNVLPQNLIDVLQNLRRNVPISERALYQKVVTTDGHHRSPQLNSLLMGTHQSPLLNPLLERLNYSVAKEAQEEIGLVVWFLALIG